VELDQAQAVKHGPVIWPPPEGSSPRQAMSIGFAHRLRTPVGSRLYECSEATVEPCIGNLKKFLGRFARRGLDNAFSELNLAASAFSLMKIHRFGAG
jgi:hypothetical protein